MKVAELLEKRRANWSLLEQMCDSRWRSSADDVSKFAALYRAACADLALADAYQLPPNTVQYLHRLVGRCHNRLYRSQRFDLASWSQRLLVDVPQLIFRDACVQIMFVVFWGAFVLSAWLAYSKEIYPHFAEGVVGAAGLSALEEMYAEPPQNKSGSQNLQARTTMAAFYISHNTGIGLKCFAGGLLVIPGPFITLFNATALGASFGYMARPEIAASKNFFQFVTAHGPFELTAIVLAAGAGLRLGVGWLFTRGMTRAASLQQTASETLPIMAAAGILFALAALIEGFLSPSSAPYWVKVLVAIISSAILMIYFVLLGMPGSRRRSLGIPRFATDTAE